MQTLWAQMLCGEQEQGIGPDGASQQPPPPSPPLQPVDLAGRLVERLPIEEAEGCLCKLDELLITGDVLAMADAQDLADECGFTEQQCDAVLLDDVAWRAKYGTEHAGAAGVHGNADVAVQEPRGEATPAKSVASTPAMTKEHESGGGGSCSSSEGDARAASTTHPVSKGGDRRIGEIIGKILRAMAATDGGKMCMQPTVPQASFGCIGLLGRSLEECLGGMNDDAVAGLYAEHCMAPDSDDEFTTKHPAFHQGQMSEFQPNAQVELHSLQASLKNGKKGRLVSYDTQAGRWMVEMKDGDLHKLKPANLRLTAGRPTTPRDEFHAVVGAAGVDTKTWTLRPDAAPKCPAGGDVPGRVLRPIAHFLGCAPAKHAKLSVCLHTHTHALTHTYSHTLSHTHTQTHTHTHT